MSGTVLPGAPATCNGRAAGSSAPGYASIADPIDPVGNPHFYGSNADGTIYEHGIRCPARCPNPDRAARGTPNR